MVNRLINGVAAILAILVVVGYLTAFVVSMAMFVTVVVVKWSGEWVVKMVEGIVGK
jgi:hypothetical protein